MILTSTSAADAVPFTPSWRSDGAASPTFRLRAGSAIERGVMESDVAGDLNAAPVYAFELSAAMRDGVSTLLVGDAELDRVLSLIDADPADTSTADKQLLGEVERTLAEHWPPYRQLRARAARRNELLPIVALSRFCVGIEGVGADGKPIVFARGVNGQVSDTTLTALHPLDLATAGVRAYSLQYGRGEAGNSPPASPSDEPPATSSSDVPSPAAGTSKGRRGRRTPA